MDLANWAFRTSPKFTKGVKYQFHQGFDHNRDLEIPIALHPQITKKSIHLHSRCMCVNLSSLQMLAVKCIDSI